MKIITIVGARPQFVKAAVVSRTFATSEIIEEKIIHTGQHFDFNMSNIFFDEMSIPIPYINLCINGLSHGAMTGQMIEKIEKILIDEKPDWVLVYGDTNSTLAGALAAKKLNLRVAHVEAGLRSFNIAMPEEINRILTDRLSNILFCPTNSAKDNLLNEGYDNIDAKIVKCGDVMHEASIFYSSKAVKPDFEVPANFILCTVHRAENTDSAENLNNIFKALNEIAKDTVIILPIHPRTKAKLSGIGFNFEDTNIKFVEPVGYLNMVYLIKNCVLVMTDSGGLQKEAFYFEKNCVTLREETEWVELVRHEFNMLAGSSYERIIQAFNTMNQKNTHDFSIELYGDGKVGEKIMNELLSY